MAAQEARPQPRRHPRQDGARHLRRRVRRRHPRPSHGRRVRHHEGALARGRLRAQWHTHRTTHHLQAPGDLEHPRRPHRQEPAADAGGDPPAASANRCVRARRQRLQRPDRPPSRRRRQAQRPQRPQLPQLPQLRRHRPPADQGFDCPLAKADCAVCGIGANHLDKHCLAQCQREILSSISEHVKARILRRREIFFAMKKETGAVGPSPPSSRRTPTKPSSPRGSPTRRAAMTKTTRRRSASTSGLVTSRSCQRAITSSRLSSRNRPDGATTLLVVLARAARRSSLARLDLASPTQQGAPSCTARKLCVLARRGAEIAQQRSRTLAAEGRYHLA
mmetsp:Transcript_237/g.448  ORF Transcript_237/g.448 Transcript_237/m.448 type:complete len:334 (+) Transcript_237:281-1282(+)